MNNIGEALKKLRKEKGFTQEELANLIKVERSTIANWERGAKQPGLGSLIEYTRLFGGSLDEVLGLKNAPRKNKIVYGSFIDDPLVKIVAKRFGIPKRALAAFIAAMQEV